VKLFTEQALKRRHDNKHYNTQYNDVKHSGLRWERYFSVTLSIIMQSIVKLSVIIPSVLMLVVVMLSVVLPSVAMLNVV
jgi:hypothetical protein